MGASSIKECALSTVMLHYACSNATPGELLAHMLPVLILSTLDAGTCSHCHNWLSSGAGFCTRFWRCLQALTDEVAAGAAARQQRTAPQRLLMSKARHAGALVCFTGAGYAHLLQKLGAPGHRGADCVTLHGFEVAQVLPSAAEFHAPTHHGDACRQMEGQPAEAMG